MNDIITVGSGVEMTQKEIEKHFAQREEIRQRAATLTLLPIEDIVSVELDSGRVVDVAATDRDGDTYNRGVPMECFWLPLSEAKARYKAHTDLVAVKYAAFQAEVKARVELERIERQAARDIAFARQTLADCEAARAALVSE